ncbi:arylsulfatase [Planctomicrobium piriforme]|uniref:Arylsulfatase A n=1 Tax=Planctomicrobium piriforme TaxID=1576369 RepID=A0A1I3B7Z3_9PLAN|nr:arylsulfatase [Planctomicrobium piriforme]SFH58079.1 Arylsulfatase A [Planctomicrobium piriforme]
MPRCSLLALVLVLVSTGTLLAKEKRPPNIILMMADDLGYGDLGCYGQQKIKTPQLDRMAAEGVRFTQFYAGSTVCAPSRCVLMTGLHVGHCQIRGNSDDSLRPEDVTIPELLKSKGYVCGMFGKWGLGQEGSTGLPLKKGFDEFVGYLDQRHAHNFYPTFLINGSNRFSLTNVVPDEDVHGAGVATVKNDYSPDVIFAAAMKFLQANKDKPFFLYLPVTLPHANNEAKQAGMEIPSYGEYADRDWPNPEKGFAAMVTKVDDYAGAVLKQLQADGIDSETIMFFTSDNGPHKEGGRDPNFFNSNGPLKGIKRDLTDGGIRVPMIVRWPGHAPAGTVSAYVGYSGDMLATCCELAGVNIPANTDSVSLLPEITGNHAAQKPRGHLYWEFYERGFSQAVRQGDWKYVRVNDAEELYDLKADIGEEHNLASQQPEKLAELRTIAQHEHVPNPLWQVKPAPKNKNAQ